MRGRSIRGKTRPLPAPGAEPWGDRIWVPLRPAFPYGHGSRRAGAALVHPAEPRVAFLAALHCCLVIADLLRDPGALRAAVPGERSSEGTKPPPTPSAVPSGDGPSQQLSMGAALGEGPHGGGWRRQRGSAVCQGCSVGHLQRSHTCAHRLAPRGQPRSNPTPHPPFQSREAQPGAIGEMGVLGSTGETRCRACVGCGDRR